MLRFTPEVAAFQQTLRLFLSPEHINLYQNFTGYQQEGRTLPIAELNSFSTLCTTGYYYLTRGKKTILKD